MTGDLGPLEDELSALGLELAEAYCCRSWPVIRGVRIGRCGYCGEVPRIVGDWATREAA